MAGIGGITMVGSVTVGRVTVGSVTVGSVIGGSVTFGRVGTGMHGIERFGAGIEGSVGKFGMNLARTESSLNVLVVEQKVLALTDFAGAPLNGAAPLAIRKAALAAPTVTRTGFRKRMRGS